MENTSSTYIPYSGSSSALDEGLFAQEQEYYMHTVAVNGDTQILTTLEDFQIGGTAIFNDDRLSGNPLHQTTIIAAQLTLTGVFNANNVTVAATIVSQASDPAIDVSGAAIPDMSVAPTGDGGTASAGNPAGFIQVLTSVHMTPVPSFLAAGGMGQNGQIASTGIGGGSGNGGNGGQLTCNAFSPYNSAVNLIADTLNNLSSATLYALSNQLQQLFPSDPFEQQFKELINLAAELFPSSDQPGTINPTVLQQLTALLNQLSGHFNILAEGLITDIRASAVTLAGEPGTPGTGDKGNGTMGAYGSVPLPGALDINVFDISPVPGGLGFAANGGTDFDAAYLLQMQMSLQKIRMTYMQADVSQPGSLTALSTLLQQLYQRLDFAAPYASSAATVPDLIKPYLPIFNEVNSYLRQFSKGEDYYGYGYNNVPLVSLQSYITELNTLIGIFSDIEDAYAGYFTSLQNQEQTLASVQTTKATAAQVIINANNDISLVQKQMDLTAQNIGQYQTPIAEKKTALETAIKNAENNIMNYFNAPSGFTIFSDIVGAVSAVATAPESLMSGLNSATSIAGIINSLTSAQSTIPDDAGNEVNKAYLVEQISAIEGGIDGLHESYAELSNGELEPDDPGAAKILADESQIETLLDSFQQALPDDIAAVKTAFENYVAAISERNTLIVKYNVLLGVWVKDLAKTDAANQAITKANEVSNNTLDPSLPEVVNLVGNIYHLTRDQVLQCAYAASRALQFWSLRDTNFFGQTLQYGSGGMLPADITFDFMKATLSTAWLAALEGFSTNPSPFPAQAGEAGAVLSFSDGQTLETLKTQGEVMLNIPAIFRETELSPLWQNNLLYNAANIRLTNVHVWLDGAQVTSKGAPVDGLIQLTVQHMGSETLVSTDNNSYRFSHQPIYKTFSYTSIGKQVEIEANFGDLNEVDPTLGKNFALVGPFTTWRIKTNPVSAEQTLDLSAVTAIRMELFGTFYTFT